jgi:hypothetical protein
MAGLVIIAIAITIAGAVAGAFLTVSVGIRRGYRVRALRWDAPSGITQRADYSRRA